MLKVIKFPEITMWDAEKFFDTTSGLIFYNLSCFGVRKEWKQTKLIVINIFSSSVMPKADRVRLLAEMVQNIPLTAAGHSFSTFQNGKPAPMLRESYCTITFSVKTFPSSVVSFTKQIPWDY